MDCTTQSAVFMILGVAIGVIVSGAVWFSCIVYRRNQVEILTPSLKIEVNAPASPVPQLKLPQPHVP